LTKAFHNACEKAGPGKLSKVEGEKYKLYRGLTIHDMRRSSVMNLISAGVREKVAMTITGGITRSVFDRYQIVEPSDLTNAIQRVESLASNSANRVKKSNKEERGKTTKSLIF
jgi:hypothetical protein